jgi:2-desacetyl-2-hydroxyethyl bacteriochlorophyllide A dehydrogenase
MKAAILYGPHDLRIVEKDMPAVTPDGVLIRVKAMGICGSDLHAYHGKLATVVYPRLIGHEVVGEVVETGGAVSKVKTGDHVVMDPVVSCGVCPACKAGRGNVCRDVKCMGVAAEGGCAEYIVLPQGNVEKIPADIPWNEAALMEPYTIGAQITARGEVAPGDTVLIMGAGPIGLVALQAAKRRRAKVIITDISAGRLELACQLDADVTVNPRKQDLAVAVSQFTDGCGVNVAVDAVGLPELFAQAVEHTAPAGRVVIIGFNPAPSQVPELPITRKELDIRGSRMHAGKFPEVIKWFAAREVKTTPLISHQFPFAEINNAFKILESEPDKTCKIIITF